MESIIYLYNLIWNPHSANNGKPQACTTWHGTCAESGLLESRMVKTIYLDLDIYIYIYFADQVARKPPPAIVGSIFCNGEVTSNQMTWNPHSANNDKPQACTTWHGICAETGLLESRMVKTIYLDIYIYLLRYFNCWPSSQNPLQLFQPRLFSSVLLASFSIMEK